MRKCSSADLNMVWRLMTMYAVTHSIGVNDGAIRYVDFGKEVQRLGFRRRDISYLDRPIVVMRL